MFAIVTAGPSAIGRRIVTALAEAGYDIAFTHLNAAEAAEALVAQVTALGRRARAWESDAGDEAAVQARMRAAANAAAQ